MVSRRDRRAKAVVGRQLAKAQRQRRVFVGDEQIVAGQNRARPGPTTARVVNGRHGDGYVHRGQDAIHTDAGNAAFRSVVAAIENIDAEAVVGRIAYRVGMVVPIGHVARDDISLGKRSADPLSHAIHQQPAMAGYRYDPVGDRVRLDIGRIQSAGAGTGGQGNRTPLQNREPTERAGQHRVIVHRQHVDRHRGRAGLDCGRRIAGVGHTDDKAQAGCRHHLIRSVGLNAEQADLVAGEAIAGGHLSRRDRVAIKNQVGLGGGGQRRDRHHQIGPCGFGIAHRQADGGRVVFVNAHRADDHGRAVDARDGNRNGGAADHATGTIAQADTERVGGRAIAVVRVNQLANVVVAEGGAHLHRRPVQAQGTVGGQRFELEGQLRGRVIRIGDDNIGA